MRVEKNCGVTWGLRLNNCSNQNNFSQREERGQDALTLSCMYCVSGRYEKIKAIHMQRCISFVGIVLYDIGGSFRRCMSKTSLESRVRRLTRAI